ncbi:MAG: NAD(P)-dependent oxidoreductase [Clostridiales Family XIII bacterium]|nr:NAD(P)-dependent oxidoreductase [Clostridiales Family XIII bacterium]
MNILVTGSSGYIGRHVVAELLGRGHRVIASDMALDSYYIGEPRITQTQEDIFSGAPDIFDRLGRPDVLIHLAWEAGFVHNSAVHMQKLSAHFRFLTDMAAGGLADMAVMGSMHEVGFFEGAVTAEAPCNPLSLYGVAKNALRQALLIEAARQNFRLYWLRGYYIYGDDMRGSSIFAKISQAAAEGKKTFPFTTGQSKYDFIHIDELARQIVAAATQCGEPAAAPVTGVINVCSGKPVSLAQQVETFIKENGFDVKLEYGAFPDRPYDSREIWGDDGLIREILAKS